ncbi:MAG: leucine-rich repeat protein [Flexilinea sp.]|nr:leucine-rich repeat protein [Flexilinea sp.]
MKLKRFLFLLMIAVISGCLFFQISTAEAADIFRITVIDVGKGDCILVQTGDANAPNNVLIDTGYKATRKDVVSYLKKLEVENVDALIISHFHKDHVGGAAYILEKISVGKVYMPDYESTRNTYIDMMNYLQNGGSSIPRQRLLFEDTPDLFFEINGAEYHIFPSSISFDGDNDNDVSMVITLNYNGHTALFAGDLEKDGIAQLMGIHANDLPVKSFDILKLPHHGGMETNTGDLLDRLKDSGIVIITDGQVKRAHGTLLDTLEERNLEYYSSADDGTIIIEFSGEGCTVQHTYNPEILSENNWKYILQKDGTAAIAGYDGSETKISIPSEIGGHTVTSITDSAFYNHKNLKSVTIPEGVTSIGSSAFSWCQALTEVSIPETVTSIGDAAFSWCTSLKKITIPDSVTSIGVSGFERCIALNTIKLPEGPTKIEDSLFERCESLESIVLPESVSSIGEDAFKRCQNLTMIRYNGTEEQWSQVKKDEKWLSKITHEVRIVCSDTENEDPDPGGSASLPILLSRITELPATGFPTRGDIPLSVRPESFTYTDLKMRIQIPAIGVDAELAGIPETNGTWKTEWLEDRAGLLGGTALPGEGFSIVAAHNTLNAEKAGPFIFLSMLERNDTIIISGTNGSIKIFRVFANELLEPDDLGKLASIAGEENDTLVLITCENESAAGGYLNRRAVFAKPQ